MNKNILNFLKSLALWFCVFYLAFWAYEQWLSPKEAPQTLGALTVELVDRTPVIGQLVQARVKNQTDQAWQWSPFCQCAIPQQPSCGPT